MEGLRRRGRCGRLRRRGRRALRAGGSAVGGGCFAAGASHRVECGGRALRAGGLQWAQEKFRWVTLAAALCLETRQKGDRIGGILPIWGGARYPAAVELFEKIVEVGNRLVWSTPSIFPWLVAALLGTGILVTLRLGFVQVRKLGHAVRCVMGHFDEGDDQGDVNHFQALSTALSATVGIGNIAGVAIAIHLGGPGAVFWMWVTAFLGMAVKFSECTLAVEYRDFDSEGKVAGGPMYYIEKGLGKKWKPLAIAFACCAVVSSFGSGNMNQANTVAQSMHSQFGVPTWGVGLGMAFLVGAVILGGIRSIAKVSSALVPLMGSVYVLAALAVLFLNVSEVPAALSTIVSSAFNPRAGVTGAATGSFMLAMMWGVRRGLFSNEAGQGSAPIAHAAARTNEPVREGAVALLEPLIDTLLICTMTALVIIITGVWDKKAEVTVPAGIVTFGVAQNALGTELAPLSKEISVTDGRLPANVSGQYNHASIDDLTVLVGEKPFTGKLVLDDGKLVDKDAEQDDASKAIKIKGLGLATGAVLTTLGFASGLGDIGGLIVTVCVILFGLSTAISWSYYGDRCVVYLAGVKWVIVYRLVFIVAVFAGAILKLDIVWAYGDLALGLMTIPNLIAIVFLSPKIVELSRDYFSRMKNHPATLKGSSSKGKI